MFRVETVPDPRLLHPRDAFVRVIDPAFDDSDRLPLSSAPAAYKMFRDKENECLKSLLQPGMNRWPMHWPRPSVRDLLALQSRRFSILVLIQASGLFLICRKGST